MPVVENGPRRGNRVALTFDSDMTAGMRQKLRDRKIASYDGEEVVDVLTASKTPATFFMTGMWAEVYPDTARRMGSDPLFEVGSHSYSHRAFSQPCYTLEPVPVDDMAADVRRSYESIRAVVPRPVPYFRFPGGCHDTAALTALAPLHLTAVQWDVISGDAFGTDPDSIVRNCVGKANPGSIVVMHSTLGTAPLTPKVLPRVIEGLRAKGLTPVKLSDLLTDH
jgi:peptidoglycan/xylan/chitin deacetylase (PgdA/CDA1 family)